MCINMYTYFRVYISMHKCVCVHIMVYMIYSMIYKIDIILCFMKYAVLW